MGQIIYRHPDGTDQAVDARDGDTLMTAAVQAGISAIEGECGGEMSCGTCHVLVGSEWSSKIKRASQDEIDLLEVDDNFCDDSRLGCQVTYTSELDGIVAQIPG